MSTATATSPIPILDLSRQYNILKPELEAAALGVLASGCYILGATVERFEQTVAETLQCQHAIGVANGSDALFLALKALGIGAGDEVITTCMSYIATSEAIVRTGATPVFVELEADTFNLNLAAAEAAITQKTKALLPVHLFGNPVNMARLMTIAKQHSLFVVEDCAQAIGATWRGQPVGSFGDAGCFSFFPTKNLGAAGDAGLITTQNLELAERLKMLRVHGAKTRYDHPLEGINSRLDALQAAILQVKLPHLPQWNRQRFERAAYYTEQLSQQETLKGLLTCPKTQAEAKHVYHQYTVRVPAAQRNALQAFLAEHHIASMIYYPIPLHLQTTHQALGYKPGSFPVGEQIADEVLSLPMFPELTTEEQDRVVQAIVQFFKTAA